MPQVYIALNDGTRYLIVKKRVTWTWRNGAPVNNGGLINQAGQWALSGGGKDCTVCHKPYPKKLTQRKNWECQCGVPSIESHEETAKREFKEECGVDLAASYSAATYSTIISNTDYVVIGCQVAILHLTAIHTQVFQNTAPKVTQTNRPHGTTVRDWECDTPTLVNKGSLNTYLGKKQTVTGITIPTTGYAHAIDWYNDIAAFIDG